MEQPNPPQDFRENILPTSTLAVVSLVSALLGFTVLPVIGGIVAIVIGYMARKETRAIPPVVAGDGMATAGIILGWVQVGLLVLGLCCAAIYFVFIVGLAATNQ